MAKTLFVVNPHAGNGRGQRTWAAVEPLVQHSTRDYMAMTTNYPEDVPKSIAEATAQGVKRIISIGGDGTNYVVVNALMRYLAQHPERDLVYGTIPAGTGRDWARGAGLPLDRVDAIQYVLHEAKPQLVDLGVVRFGQCERYFLNISSVGISNEIARRVESGTKYPWTFMLATLNSLRTYRAVNLRVMVDGQAWYEGAVYIATVANGSTFGQGMRIAPAAKLDDGLLDVVVIEAMTPLEIARAFPTLYNGQHVYNRKVHVARGREVQIIAMDGREIGMDLDGEPEAGTPQFDYSIQPQALRILL